MTFQESVRTCLGKYADFSGRATRSEYWWFALACLIASVVAALIHPYVNVAVALLVLLPQIAVGVRRLHDSGRSGWFLLLGLIPFVGELILIFFMVQPSQPEANDFGLPAVA
jgi:uncharacterized membrane protein YhaH (DUF805 family)